MTESLLIKTVERLLSRGVIVEPRGPVHDGVPIGGWTVRLDNESKPEPGKVYEVPGDPRDTTIPRRSW